MNFSTVGQSLENGEQGGLLPDRFYLSEFQLRNVSIVGKVKTRRKRKHVPHSERPTEFVEKRNDRERRRVNDLNDAFEMLKQRVPMSSVRNVRTPKMQILSNTISYIRHLSSILTEQGHDGWNCSSPTSPCSQDRYDPNQVDSIPYLMSNPFQKETEFVDSRIPPIRTTLDNTTSPVHDNRESPQTYPSLVTNIPGCLKYGSGSYPVGQSDSFTSDTGSSNLGCNPLAATLSLMNTDYHSEYYDEIPNMDRRLYGVSL